MAAIVARRDRQTSGNCADELPPALLNEKVKCSVRNMVLSREEIGSLISHLVDYRYYRVGARLETLRIQIAHQESQPISYAVLEKKFHGIAARAKLLLDTIGIDD